jgi:outer membrane protein assembly factor BamB
VASGVLVDQGVAYAAAGIVNYDGTHVYALDALTGRIRWQNNESGHLDPDSRTGVSAQGHMLVCDGRLYLAGGNVVSPAIYDLRDGACLNDWEQAHRRINNNVLGTFGPRGDELYRVGQTVKVSGKPHYAHPQYPVYDASVLNKMLLVRAGDRALVWQNNERLAAFAGGAADLEKQILAAWNRPRTLAARPLWEFQCTNSLALAVGQSSALVADPRQLSACDLKDGRLLWSKPLPVAPVPWGLAVTRQGRVIVTLQDGRVLCFGDAL